MFVVIFLFFLAVFYLGRNYFKNRRLPPGPFRFPVIGSIPQIAMANIGFPHLAFDQLSEKYGPLMSVGMGVHYMVIVSSYEYIKEIFNVHERRFPLPFSKDRNFGKEDIGIIFSNNLDVKHYMIKEWNKLGYRAEAAVEPLLQQEAAELIDVVRQNIASDGTWEVNPWLLSVGSLNVSWGFMTGFRLSADNPNLLEAVKVNEQVLHAIGLKNKYTAFPFLKDWFPRWSGHLDHMQAFNHQHQVLRQMVNEVKEMGESSSDSFLRRFLAEIDKGEESKKKIFNEEQLLTSLADMFLAGSETASNTVNWMLLYMSLYPNVQEKVYEEIDRVIGNGNPAMAHETLMPYTKAVMYETMRIVCFIPLSVPRIASSDIEIGGYLIPKGSGLTYNLMGVFHDKKHFGDPEIFRPERFIQNDEFGFPRLTGTERVIMFGVGKRLCLGEALGISNVFFFIVSLLQEFKFSVIPGKLPSPHPVCRVSIRPETYSLKVDRRQ